MTSTKLTGAQREQLEAALLDAFRTLEQLQRMVRHRLDRDLNHFTHGPLRDRVGQLIDEAESQGWMAELVQAAHAQNPGNPLLAAFHGAYFSGSARPSPGSHVSAPAPALDTSSRRAVVLAALPLEHAAACTHLRNLREEVHPAGTIYSRGDFENGGERWDVLVVESGAGNAGAAVEAERAVTFFKPEVVLFTGVAGGVKDVKLGDVVVADKVHGYERGKDTDAGFLPRPEAHRPTYALLQRARAEARKSDWQRRIVAGVGTDVFPAPRVFVGPIAAGEKVVAGRETLIARFLAQHYGDSLAVEMEGIGFLAAAYAQNVEALVVRGISDLLAGKTQADQGGSQPRAAAHAAAFAFEVLARFRRNAASP